MKAMNLENWATEIPREAQSIILSKFPPFPLHLHSIQPCKIKPKKLSSPCASACARVTFMPEDEGFPESFLRKNIFELWRVLENIFMRKRKNFWAIM